MKRDSRIRWNWIDPLGNEDGARGYIDVDGFCCIVRRVGEEIRAYHGGNTKAIVKAGNTKSLVRKLYYWPNNPPEKDPR